MIGAIKKHALLALLVVSRCASSGEFITGLIGGGNFEPFEPVSLTVSPSGQVTSLSLGGSMGGIASVALNQSGLGIVGGGSGGNAYAAFVTAPNNVQLISGLPAGQVSSVSINDSNMALIGGSTSSPSSFAAFVSPTTPLNIVLQIAGFNSIDSVSINESNLGLVGGSDGLSAYAAFVSPESAIPTPIDLSALGIATINAVAISEVGTGLIGGFSSFPGSLYAAFVEPASPTPIAITLPPREVGDSIISVDLNSAGTVGLIGGVSEGNGYAAFVFSNSTTPSSIPLPNNSLIKAVSINDSNVGLIGGSEEALAYAAIVTPNASLIVLQGLPTTGQITSVAINQFNQGLIAGIDEAPVEGSFTYAAIVEPSGKVIRISLGNQIGAINSVAVNNFFLSVIPDKPLPTETLTGNNLIFADYLNANAPQDVFYFIPSLVNDTLLMALESAAPTRNAFSFNTAMQNSFLMTTSLSTHIRDQRPIHRRHVDQTATALLTQEAQDELLASNAIHQNRSDQRPYCAQPTATPCNPYSVWFEGIGAIAKQNAQNQTPAFVPKNAGALIGFDAAWKMTRFGIGGSYLYTKLDEDNDQGKIKIQQEDMFAYFSVEPPHFYLDIGAWGGRYQTKQTRNIHMTGFDFTATSNPQGWQITPHLEVGGMATPVCAKNFELDLTLLGMLDWANAWQNKTVEKGSGPFNFKQNSFYGSLLRSEAGLRFTETVFMKCWNLVCQEKGSYVNVQTFGKSDQVHASLIGSPGSFTVETLTHSQSLGVVQLLVTAAPYQRCLPALTLFWQGEYGTGYKSNQLNFEMAWNF